MIAQKKDLVYHQVLIGILGLAVSILIMLIISAKITKPVNRLVYLVSEVSRGNVHVSVDRHRTSRDELGVLTRDIHSLIDVIKMILGDLSRLSYEFRVDNNISHRIETGK